MNTTKMRKCNGKTQYSTHAFASSTSHLGYIFRNYFHKIIVSPICCYEVVWQKLLHLIFKVSSWA